VTPAVSFVIPVRNDAARLERCIRSIQRNLVAGSRPEIVVVDNGSTDGSRDVAVALGARVLRIDRGSVAQLRNAGAAAASGEVLAFVDADHEIGDTWIAAAQRVLSTPDVGAVGAVCHAPNGGTWVQRAYGLLRGAPEGVHDVEWLGSGNLAVRRSIFESVSGFDTSLTTCEDVDLCNRIRAAGHRIVSSDGMENIHYGDPHTLWDLFKSEMWRGQDNLRVTLRGPITWRGLPSAIIPVVDLAAIGAVLVGMMTAAAGSNAGATLAIVALLVIGAGAAARTTRALLRRRSPGGWDALQAAAVAVVYDLGRAVALVARVPHRGGRPQTAVPG
jgi:GT2 family glycosyltransferase